MVSNKAKIVLFAFLPCMIDCTDKVPLESHRPTSECIVNVESKYVHDGIPKSGDLLQAGGPYTPSPEVPLALKVEVTRDDGNVRYFKRPGAVVLVVGNRVKAMYLTNLRDFCVAGSSFASLAAVVQRLTNEGYRHPVSRWLPDPGARLEVFNSAFITFAFLEPAIDGVSVAILDIDQFHDREELRNRLSRQR